MKGRQRRESAREMREWVRECCQKIPIWPTTDKKKGGLNVAGEKWWWFSNRSLGQLLRESANVVLVWLACIPDGLAKGKERRRIERKKKQNTWCTDPVASRKTNSLHSLASISVASSSPSDDKRPVVYRLGTPSAGTQRMLWILCSEKEAPNSGVGWIWS